MITLHLCRNIFVSYFVTSTGRPLHNGIEKYDSMAHLPHIDVVILKILLAVAEEGAQEMKMIEKVHY